MEDLPTQCTCNWTYLVAFSVVVLFLLFKTNKFVRFQVKNTLLSISLSLCACGVIPLVLFHLPHVKNRPCSAYVIFFTKLISKMYGITWEPRNIDIMSDDKGCVIVMNHQSTFDILCMMRYWVEIGKLAAVSKKQLFYIWPMGLAAWLGGTIFIDRSHPNRAKEELAHTTSLINKDKTKVLIFPEGTRNRKGTSLLPFKKGAFHIAIASQAPIFPVVFSPYYFIDNEKLIFGSGRVIMQCLPPIPTAGLTTSDVNDLMERTRDIMQKAYSELIKEIETDKKRV